LIVAVSAKAGSQTVPGILTVTWGTTAMTLVPGSTNSYTKPAPQPRGGIAALYYLKNPAAGMDSITATFDASYSILQIGVVSLYDAYVHGVDPIGKVAKTDAGAGSTVVSTSITTTANNSWLVDMVAGDGNSGGFTSGALQTLRWSQTAAQGCSAGSTQPTTSFGGYGMSWTLVTAQTNALLQSVAEIKIAQ